MIEPVVSMDAKFYRGRNNLENIDVVAANFKMS
jgi:hypothetical protein